MKALIVIALLLAVQPAFASRHSSAKTNTSAHYNGRERVGSHGQRG